MSQLTIRQQLLDLLTISDEQLNRIIVRSPHTYKQYNIPKKSGGYRTIAQPARPTKYLQYWLMQNIFSELPIHSAAAAYQEGSSIKKNALYHSKNSYIAKFDFKSFFPSIKGADVEKHLISHFGDRLTESDRKDIVRISCIQQNGRSDFNLSIGAPCSPILSNSILYEFDNQVSEWCSNQGVRYSRYADDLTFSTNKSGSTSSIEPIIRDIVRSLDYPNLRFNRKKTTHLSKKSQRRITGLILTNEGNVSVGRTRKREISSLIHKFTIRQLSEKEILRLQGLLGFTKDIEPLFLSRMRSKYGKGVVSEILKYGKAER
ncbi:retron St85 family RNA-directed DNA polymerase [Pseudomonadota bacterium]